jgi:hypothetical protein
MKKANDLLGRQGGKRRKRKREKGRENGKIC